MLVHVMREYNLNRVFLSWLGLWPFQSRVMRRLLPFCYLLIDICYSPMEVLMIYDHWNDAQVLFEGCYQCVLLTIFIGKLVNEICNSDKIRHLYEAIENHWNIFTSESEVRILKDYTVASQKFTIFYSLLLYCMTTLFISIPLVPIFLDIVRPLNESRPRTLAVVAELRLDQDKYFVLIFCYHVGIIGLGMIVMVGVDSMYVAFTAHACSLFTIINRQLEEITSQLYDNETIKKRDHPDIFDMPSEQVLYEKYIVCLKKHQLALEFVNTFNSAYQMISLLLLLMNGATISVVGVRIVYILDQTENTIRFGFIVIAMLLQLLILCYSGQKLIDESQDVFHRAYAAEWYEFPPRLKSLLIITLHRGIVPCVLTAGKMIPLSMTTYAAVSTKREIRKFIDNGKFHRHVLIQGSTDGCILLHDLPPSNRKRDIMLEHVLREYNANRIFLSHLGLWPFQSKLTRTLLPILCLVLEISYYPFEILMFYDHRDDAQMIFESCYQLVITTAFLVRLWNEMWNRDKFGRLYEAMNAHWDIFTDDLEIRILKEYSTVSRKFTIFYSTMMYLLMSMFVVIPLTPVFLDIVLPLNESRPRVLAIDVEFRVDPNDYFIPIFCYTTAIIVVGISIMVGADTMHFTCTTHACCLFSIVGKQIENVLKQDVSKCGYSVNAELNLSDERVIYGRYVDCLRKYQLALEFVNILNSTHQTAAIFFLLLIGATLSLIGVRVVYVLDQAEEMFRFTCIIMGALLQLMIMCYSGQKLIDESQNVFHRAYAVEWYTFSPRLKSLMIITLYRSIVPCSLTAGKLLPLSMMTYAGVVRTGMSYFTAFLSFKD
ncbi:PREDICTED: LOW QUALITY PROTEIN: uncharacterized protein LOC106751997 [Dinoponera quadriceps]|uniref:LOW QUALITY PROTEIN: uncharacterized protein LOC106751997 n=1 Tax=Dinoponera quadriceps TaxID=609295 RepID=A0A6P3YFY9_DINQU|nr:PREDICTED: LOW QUALITY PROTEIN: uncharacterized protein LOC106751997 [Dinoponera quadriceps]